MWNGENLPHEIVVDILSRLPSKSLGRFRCVSKTWRSLLCDPQFIKTHLNRNHHHRETLILLSPPNSLYSVDFDEEPFDNSDGVATKLNFEYPDKGAQVQGSCDGLLLVVDDEENEFLLNPTTRESKKLPVTPFPHLFTSYLMYGLGYDSYSDDYKVVKLSFSCNEYKPQCTDISVNVYMLKEGCWRRLQNYPYDLAVSGTFTGAFVNGSIHWLMSRVSDYVSVIAAFNLADEKFREVSLPSTFDNGEMVYNDLTVLGGCLCMLGLCYNGQIGVWLMKEYGVKESLTKFAILNPDMFIFPLCLLGDEEVLVQNIEYKKLVVYNVKEETSRDLVIRGIPAMFKAQGSFVQSLVSPNCNNGIEGQHQ